MDIIRHYIKVQVYLVVDSGAVIVGARRPGGVRNGQPNWSHPRQAPTIFIVSL